MLLTDTAAAATAARLIAVATAPTAERYPVGLRVRHSADRFPGTVTDHYFDGDRVYIGIQWDGSDRAQWHLVGDFWPSGE